MADIERTSSSIMLCPACQVSLVMAERQNVEIDYCPKCRGVWLDRGELDKIVERATESESRARPVRAEVRDYDFEREKHGGHGRYGHRRKSWLSELFD